MSEEGVRLYQVRVGQTPSDFLEQEAKNKQPIAHVLRRILEDYATLYGLPRSAVETLEADRQALGLDRREYFKELLDHRYRQVLAGGAGVNYAAAPATAGRSHPVPPSPAGRRK